MKIHNSIRVEFPSRSLNESFARGVVALFMLPLDPTLEELGDMKTAVSEAVTNSIVHAYPGEVGRILVKCRIIEGDTVEVIIKDWGCGIEDVSRAREPLFTTGGDDRSGMGFSIMESFTDVLKVKSRPGKGTTVTMIKRILGKADR